MGGTVRLTSCSAQGPLNRHQYFAALPMSVKQTPIETLWIYIRLGPWTGGPLAATEPIQKLLSKTDFYFGSPNCFFPPETHLLSWGDEAPQLNWCVSRRGEAARTPSFVFRKTFQWVMWLPEASLMDVPKPYRFFGLVTSVALNLINLWSVDG